MVRAAPNPAGWPRRGSHRFARLALGLAAVSLLASCSLVHPYFGGGGDEAPAPKPIITLRVENQNYYDATVYALSDAGERQRIGQVTGLTHSTFTFRWLHNEMRVLIQLLADGSAVSPSVLVSPGDSVNLVIEPNLNLVIPD